MKERFEQYIQEHQLFKPGHRLLIGVSGGVDSVVLVDLCLASGYKIGIAHCNFQLRGIESDRDEAFTQSLAQQLGVPFHLTRFDTKKIAEESRQSIEETARQLRYVWFDQLCEEHRYDRLLTAHQADDNIETAFMHFVRGTGIRGLRGMLPLQRRQARPLLFARRKEVEQYAADQQLQFVEDSSNQDTQFTRNYFRKELIPALQQKFPEASENMLATIDHLREAAELYQQSLDRHIQRLVHRKGNEIHLPLRLLKKQSTLPTILWEILRDYGFQSAQLPDLLRLLDAEPGKYVASATHRFIQHRQWMIIAPQAKELAQTILIEGEGDIPFAQGHLQVKQTTDSHWLFRYQPVSGKEHTLEVSKPLSFPLVLRPWKAGDYFYPVGMQGKKKKVARFLIDQKLSKTEKEKVWVLESAQRLVGVLGYRKDERF